MKCFERVTSYRRILEVIEKANLWVIVMLISYL